MEWPACASQTQHQVNANLCAARRSLQGSRFISSTLLIKKVRLRTGSNLPDDTQLVHNRQDLKPALCDSEPELLGPQRPGLQPSLYPRRSCLGRSPAGKWGQGLALPLSLPQLETRALMRVKSLGGCSSARVWAMIPTVPQGPQVRQLLSLWRPGRQPGKAQGHFKPAGDSGGNAVRRGEMSSTWRFVFSKATCA